MIVLEFFTPSTFVLEYVSNMNTPTLLNNRYQIEARIGSGGMAEIYRAHDLMLERTVAIKLLKEDFSTETSFRERFRQEAKAAANLSHPNIVTIYDFGFDEKQIFIVMEYVPGTDLKTILQRRGSLSVEEALPLIIQACAGMGYAHRSGLVHCDVKPQNMIVTPDQRLKVTDFGIARLLASIHPHEVNHVVWGSPQYFSPEQAAGLSPTPASDVYGLGVVLYEMLTGRLPFIANTASELSHLHRTAHPTPPTQINPLIPTVLEQACLKVLSKEPSSRYRTADQFGRVLISLSRSIKQSPNPVAMTQKSSMDVNSQPGPENLPEPRQTQLHPPVFTRTIDQAPKPSPTRIKASSRSGQPASSQSALDIDWLTWGLVLLAVITLGGLIPFWVWIYLLYNPPGR